MVQLKKKLSGQMRVRSIPPFAGAGEMPEPDLHVVTSSGVRIPAHSKILASATPVLESIIERPQKHRSTDRKISIPGVPSDAVYVFVQFFYTSKITDDQMEKYGMHLLALSHVYSVQHLKQRCTRGLSKQLNIDNIVDVLQLARLCDAPDLYLKCMKLLAKHFKAVEKTEAWMFLQEHDPRLELEILKFFDEAESRRKRTNRHRREQKLYLQISDAMDCLEHICTDGCTLVGPYDMDTSKHKGPCSKFSTCEGIQMLIRHFGACEKKVNGGCSRCTRMWQLFRLHSSICDQPDECRVPLCSQFKLKAQKDRRGHDARWRLLVRKVVSARTVSSLSIPMRKKADESRMAMNHLQGMKYFSL